MRNRPYNEIYYERIPFRAIFIIMVFFALISLFCLGAFFYQRFIGPIGNEPPPDWTFWLFAVYMAGMTVFLSNFRTMSISLTYQSLTVGFGWMKRVIPWADIDGYYQASRTSLNYGEAGIHLTRSRGKFRVYYSVSGKPRIALNLRSGRIRELEFSTGNPQEILRIIKKQTGQDAGQPAMRNDLGQGAYTNPKR